MLLPRLLPKLARDLAQQLDPSRLMTNAGLDPPEPWQQELLLSQHKRIALLCSRQIGKSTSCAILALHQAMYRDNISVLLVSPSQAQSNLLFEKVKQFLDRLPDKPVGVRVIQGRLEFQNRSRIISLPGNEATRLAELRPSAGSARVSLQTIVGYAPDEGRREDVATTAKRRFGWAAAGPAFAVGTGPELVEHFSALGEEGVERIYAWFTDFAPVDTIAGFGADVIGAV